MPLPTSSAQRLASRLVAVFCLLLFFYFALSTALAKTPTADEPAHIVRSFVVSQTGDLQFQLGHAPLSHRLIGAVLFSEAELPQVTELPLWGIGDRLELAAQLLWDSDLNVDRLLFLTRLPIIWLGILLGAMAASWALSWHGIWPMIVTLLLFSSSPNLIAHSALATTDLVTAATYFAAVYTWWRYWEQRQKKWWLAAAIFLGLALASKLTAVLLLPVMLIVALLYIGRGRELWRPFLAWLFLLPPAFLVLWLVYGLELGPFAAWPLSLPMPSYLKSWLTVLNHMDSGHASFFWGGLAKKGRLIYFPVTFLVKTPLFTLLLLPIAALVAIRQRALWRTALFLLIPVGALFAAAIVSNLNIGYRHVLPALPFLLVFGSTAVLFLQRWRLTQILLGLGLVWILVSALRQNPHHLAYFNEAVGGTAQGYRYLGDSNLDWGQDLKLLAETVAGQEGDWHISYSGVGDSAYYGLPQERLIDLSVDGQIFAAANPPPGQYAISANHLHGQIPDEDLFDWFRRQEPVKTLGGSILVYEIAGQAQGTWVAQCLDPLPLLSAEEAETLLGTPGLRQIFFDCRQSLVLANEGSPGWFVLPQSDSWWFQEPLSPALDKLQLVYRHDPAAGTSSYDVYYWPGDDGNDLPDSVIWLKSALTVEGDAAALPYALNQMVQLAGYQVHGGEWMTLWSIQSPAKDALSLQAHLTVTPDAPPLVGDDLGFSSEQWQAGDWLLQRHEFPEQETGLFLETALYDYLSLELLGDALRLPAE